MVQIFSTRFDRLISGHSWEIFSQCLFQLPEHLKTYYKIWSENCNEANSIQQNQTAYEQLIKLLAVRPGTVPHIPIQPHAALDQQVDSSRRLQVPFEVNTWQMGILLDNLGAQQTALHFHYGEHMPQLHTSKGKKRAIPEGREGGSAPVKKSRIRTCAKCKGAGCPGGFLSRPCGPIDLVFMVP